MAAFPIYSHVVYSSRPRIAPREAVPWLRGLFGTYFTVGETLEDGRVEVRVGGFSAESIAQQLAGWGRFLKVTGPDEVRAHLARIGSELVAQHAGVAEGAAV